MNITLLLVTSTVLTYCDMQDAGAKMSGFTSGNENERKVKHTTFTKHTEIVEESNNYYRPMNKSIPIISSGRAIGRTLFRRDSVLSKRHEEHDLRDIKRGSRAKRQVVTDRNSTWKDGVFYMFNTSDYVVQKFFKMGAKVWSEATCVDFMEDKDALDKVVVVKEFESYSDIGRLGGAQLLSYGEYNPTVGDAVHEIGHALGLFHTMQRSDRDSYIKINEENIDPNELEQFAKMDESDAAVYGLAYDYGSVMHYDDESFSTNNELTMSALDPRYQKTMGSGLISFSDIFVINEHYGCNTKCNKSTSVKCTNEGYPHPRNCSTCICPSGYGGILCDQRPPGCGEELIATRKKQVILSKFGFEYYVRDQFDFCNYMITAPPRKKIEVDVLSISYGYDKSGCTRGGVEIKAQTDQKLTGYRFCSTNGSEGAIVSSYNHLPVILFNRMGTIEANFTYRYID